MIRSTMFAGQAVAVFGLGASGISAARSLIEGGASVAAWDDSPAGRTGAQQAGIAITDLSTADWTAFAALVLAPGVPLTHPAPHWTVDRARAAGIEVIGDVELFMRERAKVSPGAPVIAITGTNGKSTTTALIAHLLTALGLEVAMGGNIGNPVLTLAPPEPDRFHVIELSSFQIDLTPSLHPSIGVLLNLTPDHLDRHDTMEHYASVKERLVQRSDAACIGVDDAWCKAIAERIEPPARLYAFTTGKGSSIIPSLYAIGSAIFVHEHEGSYAASRKIADLDGITTLRGRHNLQNALAALTALRAMRDRLDAAGVRLHVWQPERLGHALASFSGLPHRMEQVGRAGDVLFINDSKATNADSTEKALLSFRGDIRWIVGGRAKEGGIATLAPCFSRIAKAYLIGESMPAFAETLDGVVAFERCGTLEAAVARAAADALSAGSGVVLLSPACASYDQFPNFEMRGRMFRDLVAALPSVSAGGCAQ